MANIKEYLEKIKNAIYGKEVRGSIHDGIEAINEEVENTTNRQGILENKQDGLDNKFNDQIKNMTLESPSNAEIVDMRRDKDGHVYDLAGNRIDKIEEKMDDLVGKRINVIEKDIEKIKVEKDTVVKTKNSNCYIKESINISDSSMWKVFNKTGSATWDIINNTYKINCSETPALQSILLNTNRFLQDGDISVNIEDFNIINARTNFIGIVFRGVDHLNFLAFCINLNNRTVGLYKFTNGSLSVLQSLTVDNPQLNYVIGEPTTLKVLFNGTKISCFMNGKMVLTFNSNVESDSFINNGKFGVMFYGDNVSSTMQPLIFKQLNVVEYIYNRVNVKFVNNVLFIGDSITYGSGAIPIANSWVNLMIESIKANINPKLSATNAGVGGENTSQILKRFKALMTNAYDIVFLQGGMNDVRIDGVGLDINVTLKNIKIFISLCKFYNMIPVINLVTNVDKTVDKESFDLRSFNKIKELNARIKELCTLEKVICVDSYSVINSDINNLSSDKIHPNNNGHSLIKDENYNTVFIY